jgi:hypothetical protein
MVGRAFKPKQDLEMPSSLSLLLRDLQSALESCSAELSPPQVLVLIESLVALKPLGLAQNSLLAELMSRAPVLSAQAERPQDLATLIRVISLSEEEWSQEYVVRDLFRNVERHLENCAVGDSVRMLDSLTVRTLDGATSSVIVRQVPGPLRPLLNKLYTHALTHQMELSPSQAAAYLTRIYDEYEARCDNSNSALRNAMDTSSGYDEEQQSLERPAKQLLACLVRHLKRTSTAEGLSDVALRSTIMTIHRMWTAPKSERAFVEDTIFSSTVILAPNTSRVSEVVRWVNTWHASAPNVLRL